MYGETLQKRSYITFKLDGQRVREYTGYSINVQISPNKAKSIAERNYLLEILARHFAEVLKSGNYVLPEKKPKKEQPAKPAIGELKYSITLAMESKKKQNLAPRYIKNLEKVMQDFLDYVPQKEHTLNITQLSGERVVGFLQQFNNSGTYYMSKRRHFKALMSEVERITKLVIPGMKTIPRQKPKPKSHIPYTPDQLNNVFSYLKTYDPMLYVCSLLCYGCWLRPHNEVRRLIAGNFKEGATKIVLEADRNKSGRVRSVRVPELLTDRILPILEGLDASDNIFTRTSDEFGEDYFSRKWQRAKSKMTARGIIEPGHTIYSFRHTAAIDLYQKTKDVALLQRIMGHADITTTMTYLRGLGELNESDWQLVMSSYMDF